MSSAVDVQAQIQIIQQNYLARLPDELRQLTTLADQLQGDQETDKSILKALAQGLHKLAGSGGSFGLNALSAETRVLEVKVSSWLQGAGTVDPGELSSLRERLQGLKSLLGQQQTMGPSTLPESDQMLETNRIGCLHTEDSTVVALVSQMESFGFQIGWLNENSAVLNEGSKEPHIILVDMDQAWPPSLTSPESRYKHFLIGLSAQDDFEIRKTVVQSGLHEFCHKSIDATELVSRIEKLLSRATAPPVRVLVIDDDEALTQLYKATLTAAGMEVDILDDPSNVMAKLERFRPELVLMDLQMPEVSGIELASIIRLHDQWSTLPIVFLSSETNLNTQASAMTTAYADDFLTKPVPEVSLTATVRSRVSRSRQLRELMMTDGLTGLMTHASIKEALRFELSRARRRGCPVSVAMLDLDHFKRVNDDFGHAAGDKVIAALAAQIRRAFRVGDMKGRYGGEEFLVVLPDAPAADGEKLLEQLRERFSKLTFSHNEQVFSCTLSVGMACSTDFADLDSDQLLEQADRALYQAKDSGRNQVKVASPD